MDGHAIAYVCISLTEDPGLFILQEISCCSLYGLRRLKALSSRRGQGRVNAHMDMSRRIPSRICIQFRI